jgi:hypothetical protein
MTCSVSPGWVIISPNRIFRPFDNQMFSECANSMVHTRGNPPSAGGFSRRDFGIGESARTCCRHEAHLHHLNHRGRPNAFLHCRSPTGRDWPCAVWPLWSKRDWEAAVRGHLSRTAGINPPVAEIPTLARRFSHEPVTFSRQFFEQRLCFFQIGRRETLCEPSINLCQQRVLFFAPSLVAPQPGKTHGGTQLPR